MVISLLSLMEYFCAFPLSALIANTLPFDVPIYMFRPMQLKHVVFALFGIVRRILVLDKDDFFDTIFTSKSGPSQKTYLGVSPNTLCRSFRVDLSMAECALYMSLIRGVLLLSTNTS